MFPTITQISKKHAHTHTHAVVMLCLSLQCFFHKRLTLSISVCPCERGVICHFHHTRLAHTAVCFYPHTHTHTHTHTKCLPGSVSDIYSRRSISRSGLRSIAPHPSPRAVCLSAYHTHSARHFSPLPDRLAICYCLCVTCNLQVSESQIKCCLGPF